MFLDEVKREKEFYEQQRLEDQKKIEDEEMQNANSGESFVCLPVFCFFHLGHSQMMKRATIDSSCLQMMWAGHFPAMANTNKEVLATKLPQVNSN